MRFDQLEQLARVEIHDAVQGVVSTPVTTRQRRRPIIVFAGAAVAVLALVAVAAILQSDAGSGPAASSTTDAAPTTLPATTTADIPTTTTTTTGPDPVALGGDIGLWSVEDPVGWQRTTFADEEVTIITYSSVEAGTEAPGCAGIPDGTLEQIGADDTLLTITLRRSDEERTDWVGEAAPGEMGEGGKPCLGPLAARALIGSWRDRDAGVEIEALAIVDAGPHAAVAPLPPALVPEALRNTLSSLRFHAPHDDHEFSCVATRATDAGFTPPEGYPSSPSDTDPAARWYGTDDLWTVLRADGTYQLRKGVFWSVAFPGGAVEERPDISMTWHRLDLPEPPIVEEGPGTNAFTTEDGWFMIAGIDPDVRGCWEVTATYKGATLKYVYAHIRA